MPGKPRHQESDQRGAAARADSRHRLGNEPGGSQGIRGIALEHAKASEGFEISSDIAARRLLSRRHRDAVAVVLDEEQERQLFGGRYVESGPEAVGGRRGISAMRNGDAVLAFLVAEHRSAITQRLSPSHRGRVLGSYSA